jgi:hypothetical protein
MFPLPSSMTRRQALARASVGFGSLALASMLGNESRAAVENPLVIKDGHFPAKAKRIIFIFCCGGPSQVDTFDPKPLLTRDDGKELPFAKPRVQFAPTGNLLKSPWNFQQYGQSGAWVSDLFPNIAKCVDDICFINSMHGTNPAHGGALMKLHTGSENFIRPSYGSWLSYGLGTENQDLPSFLTICPTLAHGGVTNWGSAFLPAVHAGTPLANASVAADQAKVRFIQNAAGTPLAVQRMQLDRLKRMNQEHQELSGPDAALEARINTFELAFRMQTALPTVEDLSNESAETLKLYGMDEPKTANFGRMCLLARRFSESGVRCVQITHSDSAVQWDQHSDLKRDHEKNALEVDKPIAGLLMDLKSRGLLDDTLVWWGSEFGRTPTAQGTNGRDHNPEGFTMWLAGGGVKPGFRYGKTDDYGYYAAEDKVHMHDLHATILHLMGLDHERLTYRYAGRDFRLTDVEGRVVKEIIA